jgi:ribonuclease Z
VELSRRHFLRAMGLGAAAVGVSGYSQRTSVAQDPPPCIDPADPSQKNTLFAELPTCCTGEALQADEMRITFLGTSPIPRLTQQGVSVYVEVGPTTEIDGWNVPADYAMFDCGMGVLANYIAMDIPYQRMDKIFLAHLHMDHMGELAAIYAFGQSSDRKHPLYVWGPSKSGVPDPVTGQIYEDGTKESLRHLREMCRWHTESFSFAYNSYEAYEPPTKQSWALPAKPVPVKGPGIEYDDPIDDAYALVPIVLAWEKYARHPQDCVAYWNQETGVKISYFPVIHTRKGSLGYKLEWNGLSMVYSSDTKPNYTMLAQASGVDVLAHEMVMPPLEWAMRFARTDDPNDVLPPFLQYMKNVQNSSHTTQAALAYMLGQMQPPPRLTVATHFQAQDDTIACARGTIDRMLADEYGPDPANWPANMFASDFAVVNVRPGQPITVRRAQVSRFAFAQPSAPLVPNQGRALPKYRNPDGSGNPYAQVDREDEILDGPDTYDANGYYFGEVGPCPCPCP